jgi:hypothetical protein
MKYSHLLRFAAGVPLLACAQADRIMPAAAEASAVVTPLHSPPVGADCVALKEPPQSPAGPSGRLAKPAPLHGARDHEGAHR